MIPVRKEILWDIDLQTSDPDINKSLVIERVLSLGNLQELKFIFSYYGAETIRQTLKTIGYFDPKTFEFIISFLGVKKEEMKCFIKKQSVAPHWS